MAIRLKDVDPTIAAELKQPFRQSDGTVRVAPYQTSNTAVALQLGSIFGLLFFIIFGFVATLIVINKEANQSVWVFVVLALCVALAGFSYAGYLRFDNRNAVRPDTIRHQSERYEKQTAERAYCETLAYVIKQERTLGEEQSREIVRDMNGLLQSFRDARARQEQIEQAASSKNLDELQSERDTLATQQQQAQSEAARETFLQAVALLDERLTRVQSLQGIREQAEAQQAAILQAFRGLQAALASLHLSPQVGNAGANVPLASVTEAVQTLNRQARAAEAAHEELQTLGLGKRG